MRAPKKILQNRNLIYLFNPKCSSRTKKNWLGSVVFIVAKQSTNSVTNSYWAVARRRLFSIRIFFLVSFHLSHWYGAAVWICCSVYILFWYGLEFVFVFVFSFLFIIIGIIILFAFVSVLYKKQSILHIEIDMSTFAYRVPRITNKSLEQIEITANRNIQCMWAMWHTAHYSRIDETKKEFCNDKQAITFSWIMGPIRCGNRCAVRFPSTCIAR